MIIIAEVGSNVTNLAECMRAIESAKTCDADFVKFQCFSQQDLTRLGNTERFIDPLWFKPLKDKCDKVSIGFMCSCFHPETYVQLNPFVDIHKIASAELTDTDILDTVNSFKKPVILSTAGSEFWEIKHALLKLKECPVTIMHCVGDYPAKIIDMTVIKKLMDYFGNGYDYGYSDHSIDVLNIPMMAKVSGCSIIEKHFNPLNKVYTPDSGHSLNPREFKLMVDNLRGRATSDDAQLNSNIDMKELHKRRFVVTRFIDSGETLRKGINYEIYRCNNVKANPITTFRPWDIEGKIATKDLHPWEALSYTDVE